MEILNCLIDHATPTAWKGHFAPTTQPFFARRLFPLPSGSGSRWLDRGAGRGALSLSAHDTFATYEVANTARHLLLLDEGALEALPPEVRTDLEGVAGVGDSGSPALIKAGGSWQVAGVASWEDSRSATGRGQYGTMKFYVAARAIVPWIDSVVDS